MCPVTRYPGISVSLHMWRRVSPSPDGALRILQKSRLCLLTTHSPWPLVSHSALASYGLFDTSVSVSLLDKKFPIFEVCFFFTQSCVAYIYSISFFPIVEMLPITDSEGSSSICSPSTCSVKRAYISGTFFHGLATASIELGPAVLATAHPSSE